MRLASTSLLVLVALAAASVGPASGQDGVGAGLELTVRDSSGEPLPGVQVRWTGGTAEQGFESTTWTDEDGKALVYDDGEVAIRFEPPDEHGAIQWLGGTAGRTGARTVVLRDGQWPEPETVELPEGGAIAGTARLLDGTPAAWVCALVRTLEGDLVTRAFGDEEGRWATRATVPEGEYVIEVQHCSSTQTWAWHGGDSAATASRIAVHAEATTSGVDVVLDPALRPSVETPGRPISDAEVREQHDVLNGYRADMGLDPVRLDWTMVDALRLHGRYLVHNPEDAHEEDADDPWYSVEGAIGGSTSGIGGATDIVAGLSHAPFHWFNVLYPDAAWMGVDGWFAPGDLPSNAGLHLRDEPAEDESVEAPRWPIVWPARDSLASGRNHFGEHPPPAGACGYHDPDAEFQEFGFPIMAQFPYDGEPVAVDRHEVLVDGTAVESCAMTAGTYENPHDTNPELSVGRLRQYNAVIVMPKEPFPPGALVEVELDTNHGQERWRFETPLDDVAYGALRARPGAVEAIAQEPDARSAAIALSQRLFGPAPEGFVVAPSTVVLCREDVFADCLAVSPLLDQWTALLFTAGGADAAMPPEVRAEVERLRGLEPTPDFSVVIAGGIAAVSEQQADELRAMGIPVDRVAGASRVETASDIADRYTGTDQPVLLARADDWADAITVGAFAAARRAPVLLTQTDALHPAAEESLGLRPGQEVLVLGGTAALSDAVQQEVAVLGHPVRRVQGASRVETSVAIAREAWGRTATAPGDGFAFADTYAPQGWQPTLLAAQLSSRAPTPVLVAGGEDLHPAVAAYLAEVEAVPVPAFLAGPSAAAAAAAVAPLVDGCRDGDDRPRCS